jgi:hypothetical protein
VRLLTLGSEDRPQLLEELAVWCDDSALKKIVLESEPLVNLQEQVRMGLGLDPNLQTTLGEVVTAVACALLAEQCHQELMQSHTAVRIAVGSVPMLVLLNRELSLENAQVLYISIELNGIEQPAPTLALPISSPLELSVPTSIPMALMGMLGLNTLMLLYLIARK